MQFFGKTPTPRWLSPQLQPRFDALWLLAFPKTKITFEREEISDHWWDSGKYDKAAYGNWENCVRFQCMVFLVSCIFFNKCLYFSHYMAGYLLDGPCIFFPFYSFKVWFQANSTAGYSRGGLGTMKHCWYCDICIIGLPYEASLTTQKGYFTSRWLTIWEKIVPLGEWALDVEKA